MWVHPVCASALSSNEGQPYGTGTVRTYSYKYSNGTVHCTGTCTPQVKQQLQVLVQPRTRTQRRCWYCTRYPPVGSTVQYKYCTYLVLVQYERLTLPLLTSFVKAFASWLQYNYLPTSIYVGFVLFVLSNAERSTAPSSVRALRRSSLFCVLRKVFAFVVVFIFSQLEATMNALRLSTRLAPRALGLARSVKPNPTFSKYF